MNHFKHQLGILFDALADVGIFKTLQLLDDVVNHFGVENTVCLEDAAVGGELVGRFGTGSGQLCQCFQFRFVLSLMDVDVHVCLGGEVKSTLHLETVTGGDDQTGQQQIDVGGTVGAAELNRLFLGVVLIAGFFVGVGQGHHIRGTGPAERHTHEDGAVAVAPTDGGRSFLMGNETEIGGGVGVAERGERGGAGHITGDGSAGDGVELAVLYHLVHTVLHDAGVDVETTARFACGNLRGLS